MPSSGIDPLTTVAQVAAGFGLAACAGLRAFLPLLALGVASRAQLLTLPASLEWLGGTPALVALSIAVLFEIAGDKIPVLDHLLDAAGTVLRPAIGAFAATAPMLDGILPALGTEARGEAWALLGLTAGGGAAIGFGVHAAKAAIRLMASALTLGVVNPILSLVEDAIALLGAILSLLLPLLALIALSAGLVLLWRARRRGEIASPGAAGRSIGKAS